jgi:hypothetical protein
MYFTRKYHCPSIEDFLKSHKSEWKEQWKFCLHLSLREDAHTWWKLFDFWEWMPLFEEELGNFLLYKCYHTKCKDKYITKGLFSCGKYI